MNWQKSLKSKVRQSVPLKDKTTFKIGGPARFFAEPEDEASLKELVVLAKRSGVPVFIIGAGSNILVADKGAKGLVLRLSSPHFKKISFVNNRLTAACGIMLPKLVAWASGSGLSGLEFLAGIPGTLGGALSMNAGAWGKDMRELVEKVKIMDYNGNIKYLGRDDIEFAYRRSSLSKYIILEAVLKLKKLANKKIVAKTREYLVLRKMSQDRSFPNAGCIFRNPDGRPAGMLIDLCGLKGRCVGGARVSSRHANFILNCREARARDVLGLMRLIKARVKRRFGIALKPEIKIWQ